MFKTKLNNNKGSALIFTIIIIFLLMILLTGMLSVAVSNLKVSKLSSFNNNAYYEGDGEIEEAIKIIKDFTYKAEVEAREYIDDGTFLNESDWIDFKNQLEIDLITGAKEPEEVSRELKNAYHQEYLEKYYDIIFDGSVISSPTLGTTERAVYSNYELDSDLGDALEEVLDYSDGEEVSKVSDFIVMLKSDGEHGEMVEAKKSVNAEIELVDPEYDITTSIVNKTYYENEVLNENVLLANGDIKIDSNITVNGDIYSYGSNVPTSIVNLGSEHGKEEYNGIIIGENVNNVSVDITGDLKTRSNIELNNDSDLSVSGSTYSNFIYVKNNSLDQDPGSVMTISESAYILEDLYIADDNAEFETKNFYGIYDGSQSTRRNVSSGIIVDMNTVLDEDAVKISNQLVVMGKTYITYPDAPTDERRWFQTGESFTTNRNRDFYSTAEDLDDIFKEYGSTSDPVELIDKTRNDDGDEIPKEKEDHFVAINNLFKNTPGGGIDDWEMEILRFNKNYSNYSLGILLGKSDVSTTPSIHNPKGDNDGNFMSEDDVDGMDDSGLIDRDFMRNVDLSMNLLAHSAYVSGSSDSMWDNLIDISGWVSSYNNSDSDEYIQISINDITIDKDITRGIVVSKGDVTLSTNATSFTGIIIAEGDIIIEGSDKTLTYDKELVYELISTYEHIDELINVFKLEEGKSLSINGDGYSNIGELSLEVQDAGDGIFASDKISGDGLDDIIRKENLKTFIINTWIEE